MRLLSYLLLLSITSGVGFAQEKSFTVAADGTGDFKTVQEAIVAVPDNPHDTFTIHIKPGTYSGPFIIPKTKPHLTLMGNDAATTILTWSHNVRDPMPPGGYGFNPGMLVRADNFQAYRLTIENTSGDHGQALALRVDGDRDLFASCRITGWQDTLMINSGRDYFQDCYIAGRVDFIYGSATAWFQHCELHSRNGGHVTAASTPKEHPFGFVFSDCTLTGDALPWDPATTNPATTMKAKVTPSADLGRPWRADASVTFLNCFMGDHIKPAGWNNWGKVSNETTARYSEYRSRGPGAAVGKRVFWSRQLTDEEVAKMPLSIVVGGEDHWDPAESAEAWSKQRGSPVAP
jgi:pectinesterase